MSNRQVIAESANLRLLANQDDAELRRYDGELLLTIPWTAWRATSPLKGAELALNCLRPAPPRYVRSFDRDAAGNFCGFYISGLDEVRLYAPDGIDDDLTGSTLIHECVHACGTKLRCDRPYISGAEAFIVAHPEVPESAYIQPTPQFDDAPLAEKREELTAALGTALIAPKFGIVPKSSASWPVWFHRSTLVPLDVLKLAVRDAQAACDFILRRA